MASRKNPGRHICNADRKNTVERQLSKHIWLITVYSQCSICHEHMGQTSSQEYRK